MKLSVFTRANLLALGCALALSSPFGVAAQGGPNCPELRFASNISKPGAGASPNSVNAANLAPGELAAYTAFYKLNPADVDKRIQTGESFLQKFPGGAFSQAVYSQLSIAEYQKQDYAKMDEYGDQALALNPDDVTVLVFDGWVIPHWASPTRAQLEKAEKYEKHVLDMLPAMPNTTGISAKEFAAAKSQYAAQAHSGLGLVYYRQNRFAEAATELRKSVAASPQADPTDLYALGVSLNNLDRFAEAASAFKACARIPGGQESLCKQKADVAKKQAALKPIPSTTTASN
jgi:tetratricopeptide (TPR) repeat protein